MPTQPPWEIRVGRKAEVLGDFRVPAHKLQKHALMTFLRALVVRYRTDTPEDMLAFYVNNTRGTPTRLPFAEVTYCEDLDRQRVGYWCGTWESWACAMHEISAEIAAFVKQQREKVRVSEAQTGRGPNRGGR